MPTKVKPYVCPEVDPLDRKRKFTASQEVKLLDHFELEPDTALAQAYLYGVASIVGQYDYGRVSLRPSPARSRASYQELSKSIGKFQDDLRKIGLVAMLGLFRFDDLLGEKDWYEKVTVRYQLFSRYLFRLKAAAEIESLKIGSGARAHGKRADTSARDMMIYELVETYDIMKLTIKAHVTNSGRQEFVNSVSDILKLNCRKAQIRNFPSSERSLLLLRELGVEPALNPWIRRQHRSQNAQENGLQY